MSVYFHGSFNLDCSKLSGILEYLVENPTMSDQEIASNFGYNAPFTKRNKAWLRKCGILQNSSKVKLTDFGEVIYEKDPSLKQDITLWYMHSILTSDKKHAESWNYFYNDYLPQHERFSKTDLSKALSMKLMAHHPKHFKTDAPMIKVITRVLIDSYISDDAFGPLQIINKKNSNFLREKAKMPINWTDPNSFSKQY